MSELKKILLDVKTQETIWNLLHGEREVVAEVLGTEVKLSFLPIAQDDQREVIEEIESDPELQRMLRDSEDDEKAGLVYTFEEAIQYIREHHSK